MATAQVMNIHPDSAEVGTTEWANEVRDSAKTWAKNLDTGYMKLAEMLYYIYDTPVAGDPEKTGIYYVWGYKSFAEYSEQELGVSSRKAYYLRRIWYTLNIELELEDSVRKRLIALGWAKVREISRVLSAMNAERWATLGETSNYSELEAAIKNYVNEHHGSAKEARESEEGPVEAKVNFERFALVDEQNENVQKALDAAHKLSGSDVKSNNLDLICTDFLANNEFSASEDQNRMVYLRKTESLLGVKIIAIDSLSNELVFGAETLDQLADADSKE